jgi:hypothetical protein
MGKLIIPTKAAAPKRNMKVATRQRRFQKHREEYSQEHPQHTHTTGAKTKVINADGLSVKTKSRSSVFPNIKTRL